MQNGARKCREEHRVKSVRIRSFSGPYFPAFGLNTERYGLSFRIQPECGKIQTRKTPNMNTFHAVKIDTDPFKRKKWWILITMRNI